MLRTRIQEVGGFVWIVGKAEVVCGAQVQCETRTRDQKPYSLNVLAAVK